MNTAPNTNENNGPSLDIIDGRTKTLKVCKNRGNDRVWIEGSYLLKNGFANGDLFTVTTAEDSLLLDFEPDTDGRKRKIAGKPERPIIDMTGKAMSAFFKGATHYTVTARGCTLTITRAI